MKEFIGIGIMIACVCLGIGGCCHLIYTGEAARIRAEKQIPTPK